MRFFYAISGLLGGALVLVLITVIWIVLCVPLLWAALTVLPAMNMKPIWKYREFKKKLAL